MSLLDSIPNPFDKSSTLSGKTKKLELINENVEIFFHIRNIITLSVLSIILIIFTNFPLVIVGALITIKILTEVIIILIQKREISIINSIDTTNNAKSFRKLLIVNEYWELIKSIVRFLGKVIFVSLIFIFFKDMIINYLTVTIPAVYPIKPTTLMYFILVLVLYRIFQIFIRLIKYHAIKNLKETDDFAQTNRDIGIIEEKLDLIKNIPGAIIIIFPFYFVGIPIWVPSIFVGIIFLMILLTFVTLKRMKSVDFSKNNEISKPTGNNLEHYQDEQISYSIFGIMKVAAGLSGMFKIQGFEFLGKGKKLDSENSLLITNHRLLFIQVPMSGGDNIVDGTDYTTQNVFFNRGELRQNGENILKTKTISQIFELGVKDIEYKDIKTVTLQNIVLKIVIEKSSGEKIAYSFLDKEYYESIKRTLEFYLKDKFSEN